MLCTLSAYAQNVDTAIKDRFTTMNQAMVDGDYAKAADYISEELFTMLPKEQFVGMMEMMMNNPQLEVGLTIPTVLSVGDVTKVSEKFYVVLATKSVQNLRLYNADGQVAKLTDSPMVQQAYGAWKTQMGEENIKYDESTGQFSLTILQKVLAVSPDGKSSWKFLTVDEASRPMIEQVVPEEVMNML